MTIYVPCQMLEHAFALPMRLTEGAAGHDLYAAKDPVVTLLPGEYKLIRTGVKLAIPKGYEAQVRSRSGLALKHGVVVLNSPGTIDSDYRGEIGVILINHGNTGFVINPGDRIAQLVFNKIPIANLELTNDLTLHNTTRQEGGFGSTGVS